MKRNTKQLSNPFSTGGGGPNFETRVQAAFTVLMLTGGFTPCPPAWPITKIKLQGKHAGFDTDDMIVFRKEPKGEREARLLAQVKHSIRISKANPTFFEVIQAAWNDFNNPKVFSAGIDSIALVTGPLTGKDMEVRTILEWARHSEDAREFLTNVNQARFSSATKRAKLDVFRRHLVAANGGAAVTDDQLWEFMKRYHLFGYDLDIQSGVIHSLLQSLIGQYSTDNARAVWTLIIDEVQAANQNAGTITLESLSDELCGHFEKKVVETIPITLTEKASPFFVEDWNKKPFTSELATAMILGGWDESTAGDVAIAAEVAKENFAHWIPKLREILQDSKYPLVLRNGIWTVNRKEEMWQTLGPRIFDTDLEVFKTAAISVLSEHDPLFELPPDDRYMAHIQGKVLSHSRALRKGLSDTLALLGSQPKVLTHCSQGKPETVALLVVREVLGEADWVLWGSLNDLLPLLAEAAPNEFLDAVESALQRDPCPFAKLFEQEGTGITGGNYLTGLLLALETLAWDEKYLSRVAVILGEMGVIDPGGSWSNRPANSLTTIFLPWLPQTTASVEKRYVAVKTLKKEVPSSAWHVLLNLLPNQHQMSSGTHKPIWRQTIPEDWEKGVNHNEYWEQISFYADLALEMATEDPAKLPKLVESLDSLPRPALDNLITHIQTDEVVNLPEEQRTRLWSALTEFTARHRRYPDEDWALEPSLVDEIEKAAERLSPESLVDLHRRLFSDGALDLYESSGDWQEEEKKLSKRRQDAVQEIFASGGIDAVLQLASKVESPSYVGASFGVIAEQHADEVLLPKLLDNGDRTFAQFIAGFIWSRYREQGWKWVDELYTSQWTASQLGQFLTCLPFCSKTWKRSVELLGADEVEYWAKVVVYPFKSDIELGMAIEKLLEHHRPNAAIDCLYGEHHRKRPLNHSLTVRVLLSAVSTTEPTHSMNVYHAVELIKALQVDSRTDQADLFRVEWSFLPVLHGHRGASPRLLERRLASETKFFCEVIQIIFRSKNEDTEKREPTEQQRSLAKNAYRLLHEWKTPPGAMPDGSYSPEQFHTWLECVKSECKESGHLEVALSQIGQVLIHAPPDPGGLWIHKSVAEILNAKDAEEMRRGFSTGIFNSRGVHFVDATGAPERELVVKYRQYADDVENQGYHRLAAAVNRLADTYSREAERIITEHDEVSDP